MVLSSPEDGLVAGARKIERMLSGANVEEIDVKNMALISSALLAFIAITLYSAPSGTEGNGWDLHAWLPQLDVRTALEGVRAC